MRQGPGSNPWRVPECQVLSSCVWSARLHPHAVPYRVALTRFTLACCAKWCKYSLSILVFSPDLVLTYSVHRSKSRLMINAEWLWTALLSFPRLQMFAGAAWAPARSPPGPDSAHKALSNNAIFLCGALRLQGAGSGARLPGFGSDFYLFDLMWVT